MEHSEKPDINLDPGDDWLARNSLERIRQRLIDTSARSNRLINCSQDRTQVIRLVDELPDQVYKRLTDGRPFDMAPVPAPTHQELLDDGYIEFDELTGECIKNQHPTADAWARRYGINTEYDLPDGISDALRPDHSDGRLQTLLFPDVLNTRLNKLSQLAKTAREESGANILYLALGFLEWYESTTSKTQRLSPLFVVPVDLTRGKQVSKDGLRNYRLTLRDDGLLQNVSLSQRMKQDFGLAMPLINDDSEPESYFAQIRRIIEHVDSRWKVNRYASLCLLDFTKQLMYEDLNPSSWPDDSNLANHPLLQVFLNTGDSSKHSAHGESLSEHMIDKEPDVHSKFPLIYEADSSQHSALIDVVKGKNLVIEGPPGTGKSQTITNLIAACLNQGLSVLFVAEKLAALEVVKKRLDAADLGDFCLEIHSHKSSKLSILNSLMDSQKRRENATAPDRLREQIRRYEEHKETLHHYAEKLNKPWQASELTPHQILQRATNFGDQSPLRSGESVVQVVDPQKISASFIVETLASAERLQSVFEAVARQTPGSTIDKHPWYGVRNGNIAGPQRTALIDTLTRWTELQQRIMQLWAKLQSNLQIDPVETPDQDTLSQLMGFLDNLPDHIPEALLGRVDELHTNKEALHTLTTQREKHREKFKELPPSINPEDLLSAERATATSQALMVLRDELGLTGSAPVKQVAAHADQLDKLRSLVNELYDDIRPLEGTLPAAFDNIFDVSINGLDALGELLDITASLPAKLWRYRDERYLKTGFLSALDEIEPRVIALREQHNSLAKVFSMNQLPNRRILEDIDRIIENSGPLGFIKSDYRTAKQSLTRLTRIGVKPAQAKNSLADLIRYQQDMNELAEATKRNPALGSAFRSLDTNFNVHRTMAEWYQSVADRFGQHSLRMSPKADALYAVDENAASLLIRAAQSDLGERARKLTGSFAKLRTIYPLYFSDHSNNNHVVESATGLNNLINRINDCLMQMGNSVLDPNLPLSELINLATSWSRISHDHHAWTETKAYTRFVPSLFAISAHPNVDDSRASASLTNAQYLADLTTTSNLFSKAMQQEPSHAQLDRLREAQPELISNLHAAATARQEFETVADVERAQWQADGNQMAPSHLRNTLALQQTDWLDTWLSYQRVKQRTGLDTLSKLTDKLEDGTLPADQTHLAIQADLYQHLALHMMCVDDELANLDGNEIQAIRQQFQKYDKELLGLQRQQIAATCSRGGIPIGNNRGAVGTYSQLSLIQHEATKKKAHIAIRSLLKRASSAIQALKPCFMMSPMSVAQYLEPGQYNFDVIVMDEASQIRPEEALGAIARAKQLVVVGDPKQLPPTSFFSRMASDDDQDDDEDVGLQRAESILDAVIPVFPTRRLRWHYRSRHESLIAFSNQKFYDSDLVLFPSPFNKADEFGIKFTHLNNGTFNENVNLVEADRIVKILSDQLLERPDESVGVVAMNIKQRDQIEAQWEKLLTTDNVLQSAYERNQDSEEPVFFKNLENVQGDERDVIIISMTYGPQTIGGTAYQRFGPINSDVGWRRLNVLLTRSKKRMEIVSSMSSGDVRADSSSKLGVQSLRALLEYCETGHLQSSVATGKSPDSAFEIAVMRKLAAAGYESEPQVGVAGFFIDLAVRNPDKPGEFLMGIECDGATYHSAKTARDRDRLRQEVLEGLGWEIRRIWSTDWFRNSNAQLQPIVDELDNMRATRLVAFDGAEIALGTEITHQTTSKTLDDA